MIKLYNHTEVDLQKYFFTGWSGFFVINFYKTNNRNNMHLTSTCIFNIISSKDFHCIKIK